MAAQASIVRPWRLGGLLLALIPVAAFACLGFSLGGPDRGLTYGLIGYLVYRIGFVRFVVCRDHRRGISLTMRGAFEEAISAFRTSEEFWSRHATLDRLRAPLLGSATSHSFHVLARYNQAYCLSRLGRGSEALALAERILASHPDMVPARELRDILEAGSRATASPPPPP